MHLRIEDVVLLPRLPDLHAGPEIHERRADCEQRNEAVPGEQHDFHHCSGQVAANGDLLGF